MSVNQTKQIINFQFSSYPKCTLHDDYGKLLLSKMFCDVEFVVGDDEIKIPAHLAMVAARSQWLRQRIRQAREARDNHLEKVFGTVNVPFKEIPLLEVSKIFYILKSILWNSVIFIAKSLLLCL